MQEILRMGQYSYISDTILLITAKKQTVVLFFSFEPCKIQKLQVTCCILDTCCYKLTSTVKT